MAAFQCIQVEVDVMGGEVGQLGRPDDEDSVGTSRNTYVLRVSSGLRRSRLRLIVAWPRWPLRGGPGELTYRGVARCVTSDV